VRRLADPLGTDTAGLTRLVDRLEAKGLIIREPSPSDRRAVVLELTPAGRELLPELIAAFKRAHDRLLKGIDRRELDHFLATLHRRRENLHGGAEAGC
jgi:DNA-binding MarR family transcriptional regulator